MSLEVDSSPDSRKHPRPSNSLILINLVEKNTRGRTQLSQSVPGLLSVFQNCEVIDLAPKFMVIF